MQLYLDEKDIIINGANFHYYQTPVDPSRSKPPLVLQHGSSDNGLCWEPVAHELAESYDILMPDARGHGRSARLNTGERLDQTADLASLLHVLGIKRAIVAGHSMGALIVSGLTARFPDLVRATILEDPPWFIPDPEAEHESPGGTDDSAINPWRRVQDQTLQETIEECHTEHPAWPDSYVLPWCRGKKEWDLNFLKFVYPWGAGWQNEVSSFACPVLLITADPSLGAIVTPEVEKAVTTLNPNIQIANFSGVGHHVRFAVHGAYMHKAKSFLDEIEN